MKYNKYISFTIFYSLLAFCSIAQNLKPGDSVEVTLNGIWNKAVIVSEMNSDKGGFTVRLTDKPQIKILRNAGMINVSKKEIRLPKSQSLFVNQATNLNNPVPDQILYGRYAIYTGIQKTYIGHFILMEDGIYKVALNSAEESYGTGTYRFGKEQNQIEWTGGLFFTNRWTGKWSIDSTSKARIVFSRQTYAEKIDK